MVTIRPIKDSDAVVLAPQVKNADIKELRAVSQAPVSTAIQDAISSSDEAYAFEHKDSLVGVFGYTKRSHGAVVWMVSSDHIKDCPLSVTKQARSMLDEWASRYGLLWNYVYSGNEVSLSWLEALGFKKHSTVPSYGAHDEPYHCMVKEA